MFGFRLLAAVLTGTILSACGGGGSSPVTTVAPNVLRVSSGPALGWRLTCDRPVDAPLIPRRQTRLYVSNFNDVIYNNSVPVAPAHTVSIFDIEHNDAPLVSLNVGDLTTASDIAFDRGKLYIAHTFEKTITIVDTQRGNADLAPITTGLISPAGLVISPDGRLYVGNGPGRISVFDTTHGNRPLSPIDDNELVSPSAVTLDACGKLYAIMGNNDSVVAFDTAHGNVRLPSISENGPPNPVCCTVLKSMAGVTVDASGKLYVANLDGSIGVFDTTRGNAALPSITNPGLSPAGMLVDSRGRLYVANFQFGLGNSVLVFDTTDHNRLIKKITGGGMIGSYGLAIQ